MHKNQDLLLLNKQPIKKNLTRERLRMLWIIQTLWILRKKMSRRKMRNKRKYPKMLKMEKNKIWMDKIIKIQ